MFLVILINILFFYLEEATREKNGNNKKPQSKIGIVEGYVVLKILMTTFIKVSAIQNIITINTILGRIDFKRILTTR